MSDHNLGLGPNAAIACHSCFLVRLSFGPFTEFAKAMPSLPTLNSMNDTPLFSHNFTSLSLMALDAFVTEGEFGPIPAQNNFIPPPVPVDSTIGVACLPFLPNLSATTVVKGYTVEEPTTLIWFVAAWASDENKTTAQSICTSFFIYFLFCFIVFIGYKTLLFKHTHITVVLQKY